MKIKPPIPKEHGAWAMLYAPLMIAILFAGHFEISILLFILVVSAAFLAHEPLATLARLNRSQPTSREKFRQAWIWLLLYSTLASPALAWLLFAYRRWQLLTIGVVLSVLLGLHTYLTSKRIERKFTGEFIGVLSLTLTAPAAYYVALGQFDKTNLWLWVLNLLYFTSAVFYVKMRVSRSVKKPDANLLTWQCALYHTMLLACLSIAVWRGWFSLLILVAFVPVIGRAFSAMLLEEKRLNLKRIGLAELGYTLAFVLFLVLGLRASPSLE